MRDIKIDPKAESWAERRHPKALNPQDAVYWLVHGSRGGGIMPEDIGQLLGAWQSDRAYKFSFSPTWVCPEPRIKSLIAAIARKRSHDGRLPPLDRRAFAHEGLRVFMGDYVRRCIEWHQDAVEQLGVEQLPDRLLRCKLFVDQIDLEQLTRIDIDKKTLPSFTQRFLDLSVQQGKDIDSVPFPPNSDYSDLAPRWLHRSSGMDALVNKLVDIDPIDMDHRRAIRYWSDVAELAASHAVHITGKGPLEDLESFQQKFELVRESVEHLIYRWLDGELTMSAADRSGA